MLLCRFLNGKKVKTSDMEGLEEMMTICSMCNDSSVDFNEVGERIGDPLLEEPAQLTGSVSCLVGSISV